MCVSVCVCVCLCVFKRFQQRSTSIAFLLEFDLHFQGQTLRRLFLQE